MKICVDTMIFIDILKNEYLKIQEKFYDVLKNKEMLVTSVVTVAELMPQFRGNRKELVRFLSDHNVKIMELDIESTMIASERWMRYLKKKKTRYCPSCKVAITGRDYILADFLIGGFALTHCDQILTRDRGIYKTYFADLNKL
ncbi:MAG: type II toxin-antitoxin system VapC family toxin [Candidatus Anammoxibacter sp.]